MASFEEPRLTTWSLVDNPILGLAVRTTDSEHGPGWFLYQWGFLQFQVWPVNVHQFDHETETDWAKKEIAGAAIYREWVGENDETMYFRGRVFPYRMGGMSEKTGGIDAFDVNRRQGRANLLMRGDGVALGWYVCDKLIRKNEYLSGEGVGQQIDFEAVFIRVPVPAAESQMSMIWGALP